MSKDQLVRIGRAAAAGLPFLAFAALLWLPLPRQAGLWMRYDFSSTLAAVGLLSLLAFSWQGWAGRLLGLGIALCLFALPLSGLWTSGASEWNILTGLLPWSDASNYYRDALTLLNGGLFSSFAARRPLFAGFLAALLGASGQNLQISLAVLTALMAAAGYLLGRAVQSTHGRLAGAFVFTLFFFYARRFIGAALTETLGLPLAALGLACLWSAAEGRRRELLLFLGLLLNGLALFSRAGAFFVLPALAAWCLWLYRRRWRTLLAAAALAGAALLAALGLNTLLLRQLAAPDSMPFANFSYTLYGMTAGGKGWTAVQSEHPEVMRLAEPERSRQIYALAYEAFRQRPAALAEASLRAWGSFLASPEVHLFVFMGGENQTVNRLVWLALLALSALGLLSWVRRREDPHFTLLTLAALGILLSVPFAPPWDADKMRAYAASIPLLAALPALGLWAALSRVERLRYFWQPGQSRPPRSLTALSSALLLAVILGPLAVRAFCRPAALFTLDCPPGHEAVFVRLSPGSYIQAVDDEAAARTLLPILRRSSFIKGIHDFQYPIILDDLGEVEMPTAVFSGISLADNRAIWLVAEGQMLTAGRGVTGFCGRWSDSEGGRRYNFFLAETMHPPAQSSP